MSVCVCVFVCERERMGKHGSTTLVYIAACKWEFYLLRYGGCKLAMLLNPSNGYNEKLKIKQART